MDIVPLGDDHWRLIPGDRVGALRFGEFQVIVQPKIGPRNLLFLLGYAADPGFRAEDVGGVEQTDMLPVVAEFLARQTEHAIRSGILQGYVTYDDSLMLVRGRIRTADHMSKRAGMTLPVEVTYDEYSVDIAENRILRSAIRRMLAVPRLDASVRRRLSHADGRLDGVVPITPGQSPPAWLPSRLNERYKPALRIAEIVLRHLSATIGPGEVPVASFVVNMAKVFEDFVTVALQEAAAEHRGLMAPQYPVDLARGGGVTMRPDVVHVVNGEPQAVFDAKYKIERDDRGVPNADIYQMLAYCTALQLRRGYLVYAKGAAAPVVHEIVNTDPSVEVVQYPLDLSGSPQQILDAANQLVHAALPAAA
ncbi:McrC family protein [Phytoactinopolyspora halotolerans]|uniref:Restriction endonuclease n=1 Tax=Phytoactinopolyspora halotolerans TaxID=1981512 RepID=A0A6L9S9F6_9ACTN|nr:restriction endonuclease [Phytoactinopolyspora halotolerans]NEE01148.1 restriction endonuclease [Phytoactinopolyspora halotolerans]